MRDQTIDKVFSRQIGMRLKAARVHRKMSLEELAGSSASPHTLSRYENGTANISLVDLRQISISLDVPICYFLGDAELLEWFDDQKFVKTYRILKPTVRYQLRDLVFSLAHDQPILST